MLGIENIIPVYDNTYIIILTQFSKELYINIPDAKLILKSIENPIHKNKKYDICSLVITDELKKLQVQINTFIKDRFPQVKICVDVYTTSNILIPEEYMDVFKQYILNDDNVSCDISIRGCITSQDTFEIIYKLSSITKVITIPPVVNEIYSILDKNKDENFINDIEEYVYSTKKVCIYESSIEEICKLQNELEEQIQFIQ